MTAAPDTPPVLDLGSIRLERSNAPERLGVDEPFPAESVALLKGLLGRLESAGGLPRFLFVTSPTSVKDAGLCAVGLARAAASRGMEVLLVDFSFDRPVLRKPFPYQPEEGVTDMVLWGASLHAALRKTKDERIRVIGVGSPPPDPEGLWETAECDSVLGALRGEAEIVIGVGPARRRDGGLSALVRKTDRTLLVGSDAKEEEDLARRAPSGRIARIGLAEEFAEEEEEEMVVTAPPPRKEPPPAARPKRGLPVLRVTLLVVLLSIVVGVLFSRLYLDRRSGADEGRPARRTERPTPRPPAGRQVAQTPPAATESPGSGVPEGSIPPADAPAAGEGTATEEGREPATESGTETAREAGPDAPSPVPAETETDPVPEETTPPTPAAEEPEAREEAPAVPVEERKTEPAPAPEEAPAAAEAPSEGEPFYGVHVESFPSREDAERAAARFRAGGESLTIIEKTIPDKGTWYRIVLGRFATADEAANHVDEVKRAYGLDYGLPVRVNP